MNVTDEQIVNDYVKNKMSYLAISQKYHIGKLRVKEALNKAGIFPKTTHDYNITDEIIIHEYVDNKKTLITLQKELHTDRPYLEKILFSHGIKLRDRAQDMVGKKFNMLTVIERLPNQGKSTMYLCKCDCGNTRICRGVNLRIERVKDCGCVSQKIRAKHISEHTPMRTHGESKTSLYSIWSCMKSRCFRSKDSNFFRYGGRGITVCKEWSESYECFRDWAMTHGYKKGLTIERINVNGNYCPENCTWITPTEQGYNKRNTRKIYFKGIGKTASEWSLIFSLSKYAIYSYAKDNNWQLEPYLKYKNINVEEYNV